MSWLSLIVALVDSCNFLEDSCILLLDVTTGVTSGFGVTTGGVWQLAIAKQANASTHSFMLFNYVWPNQQTKEERRQCKTYKINLRIKAKIGLKWADQRKDQC